MIIAIVLYAMLIGGSLVYAATLPDAPALLPGRGRL
jgi:hypothetical protein